MRPVATPSLTAWRMLFFIMPIPKVIQTGTKFGNLTFIKWVEGTHPRKALYKCDCGQEKVITATNVSTGRTISCGCAARWGISRSIKQGDKFGFWEVLGDGEDRITKGGKKKKTKRCRCICGKIKEVEVSHLISLHSRSCGCMKSSFMKPHPHNGKPFIVHGYRVIFKPDHKYASKWICSPGYVYEHRYIMECHLKRSLRKDEHVHHKDGNKLNNILSNLCVLSSHEHAMLHNPKNKIERPKPHHSHWYDSLSKEEFTRLINTQSYQSIGKMFGVTGNAIKKRAVRLGIYVKQRHALE